MTIMHMPQHARLINEHLRGHSAQLEHVDLLPIPFENRMFRVGQPDKRQRFLRPIFLKRFRILWTNHNDCCLQVKKAVIILTQLRQMPAAEWSNEAAIEHNQHMLTGGKI